MRTILLSAALVFVASTAVAKPVGMGNFRRAEALKAAGATGEYSHVRGLATIDHRMNPKSSRILIVRDSDSQKVKLVKAPVYKGAPVTVLTTKQANKLGLITQAQARQLAKVNGGVYGTFKRAELKDQGFTYDGKSYRFKQTAPLEYKIPLYTSQGKQVYGRVKSVTRTVPVTGQAGESASGWAQTIK
jgi:hypothetical protein